MIATELRYQLESKCGRKGSKHTCFGCEKRKEFTRYIDTQTGELLPECYGICNNISKCGYHLSPYHKAQSSMSYADEVYEQWKADNPMTSRAPRRWSQRDSDAENSPAKRFLDSPTRLKCVTGTISSEKPIYTIPDGIFNQSLGHYDRNQFAWLLRQHFGVGVGNELLKRFQIGTSSRWPGATVFWYIDEHGRKRGGQIKLFGPDWHTAEKPNGKSKTDWVHTALTYRLEKAGTVLPDWLTKYNAKPECSPCMFGLPQLLTAPMDQPVAIVEAPKTAVLCTPYFPANIWLAVGSLSNLTINTETGLERLAPLKGRAIELFPDLSENGSAFKRWSQIANRLRTDGFNITVSNLLEEWSTTEQQRKDGLDMADFVLSEWSGYPPDWDQPTLRDAIPTIRAQTLHEWQQVVCNSVPSILPSLTLPKL